LLLGDGTVTSFKEMVQKYSLRTNVSEDEGILTVYCFLENIILYKKV